VRVEVIPLILGVLAALVGLGLLADAWIPENMTGFRERRRTVRTERSLGGEAAIGVGMLCVAAALIGRDTWDYVTVAIIAGSVLLAIGSWMNRRFLHDRIVNRGALRRGEPGRTVRHEKDAPPPGRTRIR
jgi:uncharacterized protein (DUF2062 family)